MKSGTNWLGSLLASHQAISVVGEFHWHELAQPLNGILQFPLSSKMTSRKKLVLSFRRL